MSEENIIASQTAPKYSPAVFDVGTIEQAKQIILTPQAGLTTNQRWESETPYLLDLIDKNCDVSENSVVLDYGCGIGRMSKALIDKYNCRVVGADISPSMRALAAAYVSSDKFFACAPSVLDWSKINFDLALAVWVLQHCFDVGADVSRIRSRMTPEGELFVVNDKRRIVPSDRGWVSDGKDVHHILDGSFPENVTGELDPVILGKQVCDTSYWSVFKV